MANFLVGIGTLGFGIFQEKTREETSIDANVNVFTDRRRYDESTELAVIGRQVGSASTNRYAQWSPGDDQVLTPCCLANR